MTLTSLACVDSGDRGPRPDFFFHCSSLWLVFIPVSLVRRRRDRGMEFKCLVFRTSWRSGRVTGAGSWLSGVQSELGVSCGFQGTAFRCSQFELLVSDEESLVYFVSSVKMEMDLLGERRTRTWPLQTPGFLDALWCTSPCYG